MTHLITCTSDTTQRRKRRRLIHLTDPQPSVTPAAVKSQFCRVTPELAARPHEQHFTIPVSADPLDQGGNLRRPQRDTFSGKVGRAMDIERV